MTMMCDDPMESEMLIMHIDPIESEILMMCYYCSKKENRKMNFGLG